MFIFLVQLLLIRFYFFSRLFQVWLTEVCVPDAEVLWAHGAENRSIMLVTTGTVAATKVVFRMRQIEIHILANPLIFSHSIGYGSLCSRRSSQNSDLKKT